MDSALDHRNSSRNSSLAWSDTAVTMHSQSPYRRPRIRKSRGRGLRTTNGCITCRKRHLKCDEVKPICGACAKKGNVCEYGNFRRRSDNVAASNEGISTRVPQLTGQQTTSVAGNSCPSLREVTDCAWPSDEAEANPSPPVQFNQLTGGQLALSHSPITFQNISSPSHASFAAIKWFGLLANDIVRDNPQLSTAHISLANQNHPLDHGSDEQIQLSSLQHATQVLDCASSTYANQDPAPLEVSEVDPTREEQIWQSRFPIELLPAESKLFEHFVTGVSSWIDLFDPTAQFSTFVSHLAIYNAGLMNAILALACRHLALNPHLGDCSISSKESALQYYYQTLHYVQKAMQYSDYKTSLELLATTLIISAYEMLDNSTNDWERHLEGVFLIQRSQVIHGESGGLHSAVWWAWLCQDIWAAFREKRKTLTFWVPQKPLSALSPHELAMRSIYNTSKVISYIAEGGTETNISHRIDEVARLREILDDWELHLTIEFSPLPFIPHQSISYFQPISIRPPEFAVAVQFFHVSHILLCANEPSLGGIENYLARQGIIKCCVENICRIAVTLKDNPSSLMSSQALFIAGMFTQEKRDREAVLELLEAYRERTGWPVRSLGEELQQFWEDCEPAKKRTARRLPGGSISK